jgi:hypothetical protein
VSGRVHEWAWGDVGKRTVCGLTPAAVVKLVVHNLGAVKLDRRCKSCERMRAAAGASKDEAAK